MTPEIKHAPEVIRGECRKHGCCNRYCELYDPDCDFRYDETPCRIVELAPNEYNIEAWEKEKNNG